MVQRIGTNFVINPIFYYQLTKGDGQQNHNPSSSFATFATILQIHLHQTVHNQSFKGSTQNQSLLFFY